MANIVNPVPPPPSPGYYPVLQIPASIDYTSKDWLGFTSSMLDYAAIIMPQWDTSSEGDFGVMLVELFAYIADILSLYGDRLSQEAYLPTATQRLSIINIARLLGYVPANGSPAKGTVTFQTSNPGIAVTVPPGTQLATSFDVAADQPIIYQTDSAVTVPANGGTANITVTQGITYTQQITGISDGTAAQSFAIPQAGVEDGTVSVFVSSINLSTLTKWNQVTFLVDSGSNDQVFSLFTDENNITHIQFGDNINGSIPGAGLTVYATYTVGVGAKGNQPAGSVGVMVSPLNGVSVPFQSAGSNLYQSLIMSGGSDPETNEQIRANAPQSYVTQQRAVSTDDFAGLALNIPGVLIANAIANHSTSVTLYILGPNYQAPSTLLSDAILAYFQGPPSKMLAGVTLSIGTPALILVDAGSSGSNIQLQVKDNFNQGIVVQNVTTAIQAALSPPNTSFGELLQVSSIYSAVMNVQGVAWVVIPVMTRQDVTQANVSPIQFRQSEIPSAGNVFITASGGIVT